MMCVRRMIVVRCVELTRQQLPTWNLTINTTAPTFFYCGAPGSCINWAMVGAINADAEHAIATQIELARVSHKDSPRPCDFSAFAY